MRILALDLSSKSTGWFLSTGKSYGKIVPLASYTFEEKLVFFRKELECVVKKYVPDLVVIEDAYYSPGFGNIHTLKTLTKFAGVATELCASMGIAVELITATRARKYCCGKDKIDKQGVFKFFKEKYNLDYSFEAGNDITDAAALIWGYRGFKKQENKGDSKARKT